MYDVPAAHVAAMRYASCANLMGSAGLTVKAVERDAIVANAKHCRSSGGSFSAPYTENHHQKFTTKKAIHHNIQLRAKRPERCFHQVGDIKGINAP
eukprot:m.132062 g.132062  ORF g.132062 m.132062 type:complete len:96 (-) comp13929_c0_seq6:1140-1427(-)